MVNHIKTTEKCKLLNKAELARQCGVTITVAFHVIRGSYHYMQSDAAQRILSRLRELGFLVEDEDSEDKAA